MREKYDLYIHVYNSSMILVLNTSLYQTELFLTQIKPINLFCHSKNVNVSSKLWITRC